VVVGTFLNIGGLGHDYSNPHLMRNLAFRVGNVNIRC